MNEILNREVKGQGEFFFRQGDAPNAAYIVQSGEVEIVKIDGEKEVTLQRIGKNGLFGELALVGTFPRSASARATCATTVVVVSRSKFEEKLARADPFLKALISILSDRLRDTSEKMANLSVSSNDLTAMSDVAAE